MGIHSHLFQRSFEFIAQADIDELPALIRGIYVLFDAAPASSGKDHMNVVYVGMARGEASGAKGRLKKHREKKGELWTHCSVFEVWPNVPAEQVVELEGLFRHIYRRDVAANRLNIQKGYAPLARLTKATKTAG